MPEMTAMTTRCSWPLAATQPANARPRPTWVEWCAAQERRIARQQRCGDLPFSDRELARFAFLRWLSQTNRVLP